MTNSDPGPPRLNTGISADGYALPAILLAPTAVAIYGAIAWGGGMWLTALVSILITLWVIRRFSANRLVIGPEGLRIDRNPVRAWHDIQHLKCTAATATANEIEYLMPVLFVKLRGTHGSEMLPPFGDAGQHYDHMIRLSGTYAADVGRIIDCIRHYAQIETAIDLSPR